MIKMKKIFTLFIVLFIHICVCSYIFADFIVGLDGIKDSQDIIEAQGAGFNAVTVSEEAVSVPTVSDIAVKSGFVVCSSIAEYEKINFLTDKKHFVKRDDLRFASYNAIIDGARGLFYSRYYLDNKPLYDISIKDWENIVDVISEISFVSEIITRGNKIPNPFEIKAPLKSVSYEYGGIKYTFIVNPTDKRQTIPTQFYQQSFDVVGEKSSVLKKVARNSKNNFKEFKAFVFRYE